MPITSLISTSIGSGATKIPSAREAMEKSGVLDNPDIYFLTKKASKETDQI